MQSFQNIVLTKVIQQNVCAFFTPFNFSILGVFRSLYFVVNWTWAINQSIDLAIQHQFLITCMICLYCFFFSQPLLTVKSWSSQGSEVGNSPTVHHGTGSDGYNTGLDCPGCSVHDPCCPVWPQWVLQLPGPEAQGEDRRSWTPDYALTLHHPCLTGGV